MLSFRFGRPSAIHPTQSSLPTLSSFVESLRIKTISVSEQLERSNSSHWRKGAPIVGWLSRYQFDDQSIETKMRESTIEELKVKLKRWQKRQAKPKSEAVTGQLQRLISRKAHSVLNLITRKERNKICRGSISSLKSTVRQYLEQQEIRLPDSWQLTSARTLPAQHQRELIQQFQIIFEQMLSQIQSYKF